MTAGPRLFRRSGGRSGQDAGKPLRAVAGGYDRLRPLRGLDDNMADTSLDGAQAAIMALYGAKIEAARRSLPPGAIAAAVRALLEEQTGAVKALAERRVRPDRGRTQKADLPLPRPP